MLPSRCALPWLGPVLLVLLTGCAEERSPPPPPPAVAPPGEHVVPLLALLPEARVLGPDGGAAPALTASERSQPHGAGEGLWWAAPSGGRRLRWPDLPGPRDRSLVLGIGALPGSSPASEGAEGRCSFRVTLGAGRDEQTLWERSLPVGALQPGALADEQTVPLPADARGPLTLAISRQGDQGGVVPAWHGVGLRRAVGGPLAEVQLERDAGSLLDHALPGDGDGDLRVRFAGAAQALSPDPEGTIARLAVPGVARFEIPADGADQLGFQVIEHAAELRPQGAVRFALRVDGRERWSRVLSGFPPVPSEPLTVALGEATGEATGDTTGDTRTVELRASWVDPAAAPGAIDALWIEPRLERRRSVARQPAGAGPNLLLIVVDTLRADRLGLHRARRQTSPRLTAFARRGLVFDQAMAASSWTVPSMASLFTGQDVYAHGLYDTDHWQLSTSLPTLAEHCAAAGLSTVCVMANPLLDRANGALRGFEQVRWLAQAHAAQVNRAFLDWLDGHDAERFFATLHFFDPHDPYAAPGDDLGRYLPEGWLDQAGPGLWKQLHHRVQQALDERGPDGAPLEQADALRRDRLVDLYDAEIAHWDEQFGRLLDELERRGLLDDTLVVITSDHGEAFGERGLLGHGHDLHRELLHVPLVLVGRRVPRGRRDRLVGLVDVLPTALRLLDLEPGGAPLAGQDLVQGGERPFLFAQTSHGRSRSDEAFSEWQAILGPAGKGLRRVGGDGLLVFGREGDPDELRPLDDPALAARLEAALDSWETATRSLAGSSGAADEAALEALRALGYVR